MTVVLPRRVLVVLALIVALLVVPGAPAGAGGGLPRLGGYVLDAYGGLHPYGGAPALAGSGWWPDRDLARGLALSSDQSGGYVVDAYGGIHAAGSAPPVTGTSWWPNQDLARGIALDPGGSGGYVLDAYGGLHPFGGAKAVTASSWWPNQDLARGIVFDLGGAGGYVLDAYGGLHPFGGAKPVSGEGWWPNRDLARGIAALPGGGGGYVLDAQGGLHPYGGATPVSGVGWWPDQDLARGIVLDPGAAVGGQVVDAYGGLNRLGAAATVTPSATWFGRDLARGVANGPGSGAKPAPVASSITRHVTYEVRSKGTIRSDLGQFAALAAETYADSRGWRGAGVGFQQVASGGDFTLWLAAADQMTSFSPDCSDFYSCRVGRNVVINDDRWSGGSPYLAVDLRTYRHMVVNHETGHWLGLGHSSCPGPGQQAPLMMQQSKGLDGCTANPWPTAAELAAIRR